MRFGLTIKSRIIINAVGFYKFNPKYPRRRVNEKKATALDFFSFKSPRLDENCQVKYVDINLEKLEDYKFVLFSPTILGFSLNDKIFLEFTIANISDIKWGSSLFNNVRIPNEKKVTIWALTKSYLNWGSDDFFDDFMQGKGRGLVLLLYGLPSVGKTIIAKAIAESLKTLLYVIAAGYLGTDSVNVKSLLSTVFKIGSCWKAILLLNKADMFLTFNKVIVRSIVYKCVKGNLAELSGKALASYKNTYISILYLKIAITANKEFWNDFMLALGEQARLIIYSPMLSYIAILKC
ncbi:hypothetical protein V2W45_1333377 [Cenococcum geophilum]